MLCYLLPFFSLKGSYTIILYFLQWILAYDSSFLAEASNHWLDIPAAVYDISKKFINTPPLWSPLPSLLFTTVHSVCHTKREHFSHNITIWHNLLAFIFYKDIFCSLQIFDRYRGKRVPVWVPGADSILTSC